MNRKNVFANVAQQGNNIKSSFSSWLNESTRSGYQVGIEITSKGQQKAVTKKYTQNEINAKVEKQQKQVNKFLSILHDWSLNKFSFTQSMMKKYTTTNRFVDSYFVNVGNISQKQLNSTISISYDEFIRDATNPKNISYNPLKIKKKLLVTI